MGYLLIRRTLEADLGGAAEVDLLARLRLDRMDLARLPVPVGGTWFDFNALRALPGSFNAAPLHVADAAAQAAAVAALDAAISTATGYTTAQARSAASAFASGPAVVLGL